QRSRFSRRRSLRRRTGSGCRGSRRRARGGRSRRETPPPPREARALRRPRARGFARASAAAEGAYRFSARSFRDKNWAPTPFSPGAALGGSPMRRWWRLGLGAIVLAVLLAVPAAAAETATLALSSPAPVLLDGHVRVVASGGSAQVVDDHADATYRLQNAT